MAVATAVRMPKQSDRLAATLYSPPETWTSKDRALRNGMTPGSSRWTSAPTESRSSWQASVRTFRVVMGCSGEGAEEGFTTETTATTEKDGRQRKPESNSFPNIRVPTL